MLVAPSRPPWRVRTNSAAAAAADGGVDFSFVTFIQDRHHGTLLAEHFTQHVGGPKRRLRNPPKATAVWI